MSRYGPGRIKVICADRMCSPADARTLEPLGVSCYDAWAFSDPEQVPSMSFGVWQMRRDEQRRALGSAAGRDGT